MDYLQRLRNLEMKTSYKWAGGIAAFIALWILSGQIGSDEAISSTSSANRSLKDEIISVRAKISKSFPHSSTISIRGRTEASRIVVLRAETIGRVISVPGNEGREVKKDEIICEIAMNAREAMKAQAEANMRQRELEYEAAKKLENKGHRSETQVAAAEAAYNAAQAMVREIDVEIEFTKIKAPFDGIVDKRNVQVGDFMQKGDACATVIDPTPFLIVGQVSEEEVLSLRVGQTGYAELVDGTQHEGTIRFLGSRADNVSRTFRVELEVPNKDQTLRDGITAKIHIPLDSIIAHEVKPSSLVLNDEGQIGVRFVDEKSVVQFQKVEIVAESPTGFWITGLPETAQIITVGQEYVDEGQPVNVVLEGVGAKS